MISRRRALVAGAAFCMASQAKAAGRPGLTVYKTASCSCCQGWISAMAKAGYEPKVVLVENVTPIGANRGVPFELSSCHLALVDGYVTVGHVPPADVDRLLRERPKAIGLTVPGMPMGSPGMETIDGTKERYDTLLLLAGGKTRVFARHGSAAARPAKDG